MKATFYFNDAKRCDYIELPIDSRNTLNRKATDLDREKYPAAWAKYKDQEMPEDVDLDTLGLTDRTVRTLRKAGIETADQLLNCTLERLEGIPGLGPKSIDEIKLVLS